MNKLLLLLMATVGLSLAAHADCKKCDASPKCKKTAAACEAKLEAAFIKHDVDKDGKLSLTELKALAAEYTKKGCSAKGKCKAGKCETKKSACTKSKGVEKKAACTKCEGDCKCESKKAKCTKCKGENKVEKK